jgi:hypothetical protein
MRLRRLASSALTASATVAFLTGLAVAAVLATLEACIHDYGPPPNR